MKCMSQYLRMMSLKMRWLWIWATFGIQTNCKPKYHKNDLVAITNQKYQLFSRSIAIDCSITSPNMQAKKKPIQQELDFENGYNILETKKPKLKGAKYVRKCYARKRLQLKKQQAQFWKFINEANDQMQDETTPLIHAWRPKEVGSPSIYILCW